MTIALKKMLDLSMLVKHAKSWEMIEDDVLEKIPRRLGLCEGTLKELGEWIRNIGENKRHNLLDTGE